MKSFTKFLSESVIDLEHATLDPTVFDNVESDSPTLTAVAKNQILLAAKQFATVLNPIAIVLTGSILTKFYNETSDLDVTLIVYQKSDDEVNMKLADRIRKTVNGQPLVGTAHPINFFIRYVSKEDLASQEKLYKSLDNVYDIQTDTWLKKKDANPVAFSKDIEKVNKKIAKIDAIIMQLKRALVWYDYLKNIQNSANIKNYDSMFAKVVKQIKKCAKSIVSNKIHIHDKRVEAFNKEKNADIFLTTYNSFNNSPENLLWKKLEKFSYVDLATKLAEILKSDKFEQEEISAIKTAVQSFYKI